MPTLLSSRSRHYEQPLRNCGRQREQRNHVVGPTNSRPSRVSDGVRDASYHYRLRCKKRLLRALKADAMPDALKDTCKFHTSVDVSL